MWLTGDELLLNTRFDIPAKHLYARYRASKYDTFYGHCKNKAKHFYGCMCIL